MTPQSISLTILSPCLAGGAIPQQRKPSDPSPMGEIRVPAIRGQLRWWFRALGGTPAEETEVFGTVAGAGRASSVQFRLLRANCRTTSQNLEDYTGKSGNAALANDESYFLWPLRPERDRAGTIKAIQRRAILYPIDRSSFAEFQLSWRLLRPISSKARSIWNSVLDVWPLLGALGARSRKGYGSLWPTTGAPQTEAELRSRLAGLPAGIVVRLWRGDFAGSRQALAFAARELRTMRCGTDRFSSITGIKASPEGKNDHDAADPGAPARPGKVFRAVLGLPLKQDFRADPPRRPTGFTVTTTHSDFTRWASPVHIKLAYLKGHYAVLLVIHDKMAMPAGTSLTLGTRTVTVDHALLNRLKASGMPIHP